MRRLSIHRATRLARIPRDAITRDWLMVSGGSFARLGLGFAASIVIARSLGPSLFGIYAVLATTAAIAGATGDFGLTNAAVRRIAPAWRTDHESGVRIWQVFFWVRLLAIIAIALIGIVVAGPLARSVLGLPDHVQVLRLAFVGIAATALSGTVTAALQATGHFGRLAAVMVANAALTLILALGLAAIHQLTLHTAIVVLGIGTSIASFAIGYRLLPASWTLTVPDVATIRREGTELVRFGSWLWIGGILSIMATQVDILLVNQWAVPATVGMYSLAISFASRIEVVNHSLYTVMLVSASTLDTPDAVKRYVRGGIRRSTFISVLLLPLIPLAGPFIETFYGATYAPAAGFFQALLLVAGLNIMLTPLLLLGFTFDRSRIIAATDAARVVTLLGAGIVLIPVYGVNGAIVAKVAATVVGAGVLIGLLIRGRSSLHQTSIQVEQP